MAGGRPPKPKHVKEAQGTLEKSREIEHPVTFEPLSAVPKVPDVVPEEGREFFTHHCRLLFSVGLLTAGDISSISQASIWYAIFIRASRSLEEDGQSQKSQTGYENPRPQFTAMVQAQKYLNEFQNKFGFNLASRQRISMPKKKDNSEYFD